MFTTTNLWAATLEDRDLSRAAAERYFMLQAAGCRSGVAPGRSGAR